MARLDGLGEWPGVDQTRSCYPYISLPGPNPGSGIVSKVYPAHQTGNSKPTHALFRVCVLLSSLPSALWRHGNLVLATGWLSEAWWVQLTELRAEI
jgi:hypothetical protein